MPRNITLGTLVSRCQQRADAENQTFISTDEWKNYISLIREELAQTVSETGCRYFEGTDTITTDGTNDEYALPLDQMFFIGVDYIRSGDSARFPLRASMAQERALYTGSFSGSSQSFRYALVGENVKLIPKPPTGQSYEVLYVPRPDDLSSSADETDVDTITFAGENFIVWGACVYAREKEGVDSRSAVAAREAARAKVIEWAVNRSLYEPKRRVVEDNLYDYDYLPGDYI